MKNDTEYLLAEFRKHQSEAFDEYGKLTPDLPALPFLMNSMLELINRMEEDIKEIEVFSESDIDEKFEFVARPAIKYLCENHNPHSIIIITQTSAEVLSGDKIISGIDDYIVD